MLAPQQGLTSHPAAPPSPEGLYCLETGGREGALR